jgi:uncharacterized membrane protein required for colicin V production
MFDGEVHQVNLAHIIIGFFIIWYYTLALMFLYRYAQTTRNLKLSRFLGSLWSIIVHIFILGIIITFLIFYGGYLFRKSTDNFLEAMINYTMEDKGLSMELYEMLYTNYSAYMLVGVSANEQISLIEKAGYMCPGAVFKGPSLKF